MQLAVSSFVRVGIWWLIEIRWSRAARTPCFIRFRKVGWPISNSANGVVESMSQLVLDHHELDAIRPLRRSSQVCCAMYSP
ncbi:hypothetical protein [Streptomyces sediminimaris]|uniref:hypothetical protein n=1 Tax=Streptomyces sediminimaris TaxID=3383721 RepID=UPI00399C4509